jgi:hypothetical protein
MANPPLFVPVPPLRPAIVVLVIGVPILSWEPF